MNTLNIQMTISQNLLFCIDPLSGGGGKYSNTSHGGMSFCELEDALFFVNAQHSPALITIISSPLHTHTHTYTHTIFFLILQLPTVYFIFFTSFCIVTFYFFPFFQHILIHFASKLFLSLSYFYRNKICSII